MTVLIIVLSLLLVAVIVARIHSNEQASINTLMRSYKKDKQKRIDQGLMSDTDLNQD